MRNVAMRFFDCKKAARETNPFPGELEKPAQSIRREFPKPAASLSFHVVAQTL
jgi:hypothetical protein